MTEDAGFFNVETNVAEHSATFKIKDGFDYKAKLNEFAEDSKQIAGWSQK